MKISEDTSYPYPVLAPWSSDIDGFTMDSSIKFRESADTRQLSVFCETTMNHPDITRLILDGDVAFGCFVKCQDTGFRRLQPFGFPSGVHHFAPGALLGRVQFRPIIWAVKPLIGYNPQGAHAEFIGGYDIYPGQIIALDEEQFVDVVRLPLASFESIFEIEASSLLDTGCFEVDMLCERIMIRVSEETFTLIQLMRQSDDVARTVIMNSLYVPVVMEILSQLKTGVEQFESYRWYFSFLSRCEQMGVSFNGVNLLDDAQKLLSKPFLRLSMLVSEPNGANEDE